MSATTIQQTSSKSNSPLAIADFLSRTTRKDTRHPYDWSQTHLDLLNVFVIDSDETFPPLPRNRTPSATAVIDKTPLSMMHNTYPPFPAFTYIGWLLHSTFDCFKSDRVYAAVTLSMLTLCIGPDQVKLDAVMYIKIAGVPFFTYNTPTYTHKQRQERKRYYSLQIPYSMTEGQSDDIDPYNIAVMIAMAQEAQRKLNIQDENHQFTTRLGYPSRDGSRIYCLTAHIPMSYLEGLRNTKKPLEQKLMITRSEVPVTEDCKEIAAFVEELVSYAPNVPAPVKVRRKPVRDRRPPREPLPEPTTKKKSKSRSCRRMPMHPSGVEYRDPRDPRKFAPNGRLRPCMPARTCDKNARKIRAPKADE